MAHPPLLPEIRLALAGEITPIWTATETWLETMGVAPPFWAFAWAGGQALARLLLDRPGLAAGRRVLDVGAGSGVVAIAAMLAGAEAALAADVDPLAGHATLSNARLNHVVVEVTSEDPIGRPAEASLILVGDLCYEAPLAARLVGWLRQLAAAGHEVLLGDPGRSYLPDRGLERVADYVVPTSLELEDRVVRETTVWRVVPLTG